MQIIALDPATPQLRAPPSGSTYSAPRAIVMTPEALTGTADRSSLSIAQTWNTTGTPTALDLNVTDTASNGLSLLMNLRVGGSSRFNVDKNGFMTISGAGTAGFDVASTVRVTGSTGQVRLYNSGAFSWSSTGVPSGAADLILARDAANTLAQRNGVNAQTLRVYGTFTDASNYQRLRLSTDSIFTENAGTGAAQSLALGGTLTGARMVLNPSGVIQIYGPSVLNIWNFNASGHFVAGTDNTYDIGASGAGRPRSIFTSSGVVFANSLAVNSSTAHSVLWNAGQYGWASSGTVATNTAIDTGLSRAAAGIIGVTNGSTGGGSIQMQEVTAPAAPAADRVRIYAQDNGAGKTQLMALFATGAAVQIAIEP